MDFCRVAWHYANQAPLYSHTKFLHYAQPYVVHTSKNQQNNNLFVSAFVWLSSYKKRVFFLFIFSVVGCRVKMSKQSEMQAIDAKIAKVREVVRNASKNDIVLGKSTYF